MMPARVLMVDDEPLVLEGLALALGAEYDITTCTSAAEALSLMANSTEFAVVVSDMRMPGMDGAAFLAAVRRRHPGTVRLLLTGHADVHAVTSAVNDGNIYRFLLKPCGAEQLSEALDDAIEAHRQWEHEAQRSTRVSKQLIDSFSHRLRTPLTAIRGLASELDDRWDDLDDADRRSLARLVAEQSEQVAETIMGMLAVGRGMARDLAVLEEPVPLGPLLDELRLEVPGDSRMAVMCDDVVALGDAERLIVSIRHLLHNAFEHGRHPVVVSAYAEDGRAVIDVCDAGDGIPDQIADVAFNPFVTGAVARPDAAGLGLAAAKALIDEMHGTLSYGRTDGATRFRVSLPLVQPRTATLT